MHKLKLCFISSLMCFSICSCTSKELLTTEVVNEYTIQSTESISDSERITIDFSHTILNSSMMLGKLVSELPNSASKYIELCSDPFIPYDDMWSIKSKEGIPMVFDTSIKPSLEYSYLKPLGVVSIDIFGTEFFIYNSSLEVKALGDCYVAGYIIKDIDAIEYSDIKDNYDSYDSITNSYLSMDKLDYAQIYTNDYYICSNHFSTFCKPFETRVGVKYIDIPAYKDGSTLSNDDFIYDIRFSLGFDKFKIGVDSKEFYSTLHQLNLGEDVEVTQMYKVDIQSKFDDSILLTLASSNYLTEDLLNSYKVNDYDLEYNSDSYSIYKNNANTKGFLFDKTNCICYEVNDCTKLNEYDIESLCDYISSSIKRVN